MHSPCCGTSMEKRLGKGAPSTGSQLGRGSRVWIFWIPSPLPFPWPDVSSFSIWNAPRGRKLSLKLSRCSIKGAEGAQVKGQAGKTDVGLRCQRHPRVGYRDLQPGSTAGSRNSGGKNEFLHCGTWDAVTARFALLEFFFFYYYFWEMLGLFLFGFGWIWKFHVRSGAVFALTPLRFSWLWESLSARGFELQGWSCQPWSSPKKGSTCWISAAPGGSLLL